MSKKPFDYSKWDKIELSDDEDDVHPNIDRESWFRMKHRSRVEREENEEKDKQAIRAQMATDNQRIQLLEHDLQRKLQQKQQQRKDDSDDDDDNDDLDETEGIRSEIEELKTKNRIRQQRLDEYEKNKKWNVDNMCEIKEERTVVNPAAAQAQYTPTGYVVPKDEDLQPKKKAVVTTTTTTTTTTVTTATATTSHSEMEKLSVSAPPTRGSDKASPTKDATTDASTTTTTAKKPAATASKAAPEAVPAAAGPPVDVGAMDTYHEYTEKYADIVEQFMDLRDLESSKQFLLKNGNILLQENGSNYLLLATLEDEMNGYHEKMKRTARQSQIITNIAELAKTLKTHPGNVIEPFFRRLEQREHLEAFIQGCKEFEEKIKARAVIKKEEMDAARGQDLEEIPKEKRLGPGGLDPLEVIETLPDDMVMAFESRDVEKLKEALMKLEPEEAEYHMKRCIDSGLWVQ
jgi:cell division cycle protein 37